MSKPCDIFLSYSRKDQAVARLYAEALQAAGFSVWWDVTLRSGEAYDEVTEAALRGAKAVVVLWSQTSVASRWVRAEATLAQRQGSFLPLMIEPCERPVMFELTQTPDLSHWQGEPDDPALLGFLADVARLVGGEAAPAAAAATPRAAPLPMAGPAMPQKPSIAVMPFAQIGGDDDNFLADGLTEEISTMLSHFSTLFVIAGQSSLSYRGTAKAPGTVARELGVRYLLEGSVRRAGPRVRIAAKLIDAVAGEQLWAERFDDDLADVFELQDRIASAVASTIDFQVHEAELKRVTMRPTQSPDAYELYLRTAAGLRRYTPEAVAEAISHAERAIAIDPDYGWALAALGHCHAMRFMNRWGEDPEVERARAREYSERALRVAGGDPHVLAMCAGSQMNIYGDFELAARLIERALELNPESHLGLYWGGWIDLEFNRLERALERLQRTHRLNPQSQLSMLARCGIGQCLFFLGRHDESVTLLGELMGMHTGYAPAHAIYVAALARLGRLAEAEAEARLLAAERPLLDVLRFFSNREHRKQLRAAYALLPAEAATAS